MPFVPLGSRKRIEVILDDDKERLGNLMRTKDNETVRLHHQVMAGQSGYRYANHPQTWGPVRGPAAPFHSANKPWSPPEDDPSGMAAMKDLEQAPIGASREGAHGSLGEQMRKSRSVPAMVRTMKANPVQEGGKSLGEQAKEAADPASIELNRWLRLAKVTERDLMSMPALAPPQKRNIVAKKPFVNAAGLVNFPKYMLFENSHLKATDLQRFVESEDRARKEAAAMHAVAQEALARGDVQDSENGSGMESPTSDVVPLGTVSWGAPRLRGPGETVKRQWAGSAMCAGKSQQTSNPFRN